MFREMRRIKKQISGEECDRVLLEARRGVLGMNGDDGYPYTLPINFIYVPEAKRIYFHGCKVGHKVDSIKKDSRVCFTCMDQGYQKNDWSWYVNSVVVFGRAHLVTDPELAKRSARLLGLKYFPTEEDVEDELKRNLKNVQMVCIDIEHLTGKLVHER